MTKLALSVKPWHLHVFQSGPTWLFHVLSWYTWVGHWSYRSFFTLL